MPENRRSTRLEEQIREILEQADREPAWRRWLRRVRRPRARLEARPPRPRRRAWSIEPTWAWLGATFGLALLAIVLSDWSRTLAMLLAISSLIVFFAPIVARFRRGPVEVSGSRRWRGRDIDLPPPRIGLVGRLRYWLWRLRQRR